MENNKTKNIDYESYLPIVEDVFTKQEVDDPL